MGVLYIASIISSSIFLYVLILGFISAILLTISVFSINFYIKQNRYVTYKELLISPHAPGVSIVIPVYNQADTVVDSVRALLALQYNNYDLIVVSDGCTDGTLHKLVEFYSLELVNFISNDQLKTREVLGYYKSTNAVYSKLTLINKQAGGMADALNAGVNISEKDLVLCLEENCLLDRNSLLKLVRPVLEQSRQVIYVGTAVHVANSCEQKKAFLTKPKFPKQLLPAFQVIEYLKLFLIQRVAWAHLNGLHNSLGAISLFNKEVLIQSGGYNNKIQKPGFELLVRMCRLMHENGAKYKIAYIPDPVCWMNVPSRTDSLGIQRMRWSKGIYQTLRLHKKILFNSRYSLLGMVNLPYVLISEWLNPILKMLLCLILYTLAAFGAMSWEAVAILLVLIYFFKVFVSILSILLEEKSYKPYSSAKDLFRMTLLAFIEPVLYQPLTVYWKVSAHFKSSTS